MWYRYFFVYCFYSQSFVFVNNSFNTFVHCRSHHIGLFKFRSNWYSWGFWFILIENFEFNFSHPNLCLPSFIFIISIFFICIPFIFLLFIDFIKETKNRTCLILSILRVSSGTNIILRAFAFILSKMISHNCQNNIKIQS